MTGKNHQPENDVDIWNHSGSCKLLETTNSPVKPQSICPMQSTQSAHAHCPTLWVSHLQTTTPQHTPTISSDLYSPIFPNFGAENFLPACWNYHVSPSVQLVLQHPWGVWDLWEGDISFEPWTLWKVDSPDCRKHLIIETKKGGVF